MSRLKHEIDETKMDSSLNINPQTPTNRSAHKMSSSLKKRLQKQGRYHGSRIVPPKLQRKTLAWSSPTFDPNTSNCSDRSFQDIASSPDSKLFSETSEKGQNCETNEVIHESNISIDDVLEEESTELTDSTTMGPKGPRDHPRLSKQSTEPLDDGSLGDRVDSGQKLAIWNKKVKEKEELLRKLRLVKLYRTKNDLVNLTESIARWRTACQNALLEYRDKCPEPVPSLTNIIGHLQIDSELIRYNAEDGSFVD